MIDGAGRERPSISNLDDKNKIEENDYNKNDDDEKKKNDDDEDDDENNNNKKKNKKHIGSSCTTL